MRSSMFLLSIVFLLSQSLFAQSPEWKSPDEFLVKGDQLPKVLLVGTFHFAYPDLDAHVTDKDKRVDVNSAARQKEMRELLDYISRFKPTKIMIEAHKGSKVNQELADYKMGKYTLQKNEIDQIAYRLAKKFNIDHLGMTDARTLSNDFSNGADSSCVKETMDRIYKDWDFRSDDVLSKRYMEMYKYGDEFRSEATLLQSFKFLNSAEYTVRGHGAYLVGDFTNGENYEGTDALAMYWYSRNLRIFRNIQKENCDPEDRVLVLYGAGHMSILKHLFESTPQFELVPFADLENWPK